MKGKIKLDIFLNLSGGAHIHSALPRLHVGHYLATIIGRQVYGGFELETHSVRITWNKMKCKLTAPYPDWMRGNGFENDNGSCNGEGWEGFRQAIIEVSLAIIFHPLRLQRPSMPPR